MGLLGDANTVHVVMSVPPQMHLSEAERAYVLRMVQIGSANALAEALDDITQQRKVAPLATARYGREVAP